ncbi:DUF3951 domain-containing protein [Bacillus thuringiensis]|uniref:DUF3951 domain-containing protein n=2 Tax=Bacillaceae TaxID=186817 RepID=A0AB36TV62_BACTU|nr:MULTISPECIES: DUF3951 domain-containing protein [Bacillus cereus group]MDF9530479.1 DUF3951 domain-containing protein [Bacillus cereus]MDG1578817.1 DUF3951 domain-containing protein [Bacillus cereus]MED2751230.1 DUF3951 domain-containing protein [Bacillus thuringiensis]MED2756899.1 DUF3951 domain-containing protein [Bacillus thuringiensis]MED2770911.1 DUF3951 domain-containing protein [Bacillus thuringiensis]
MDPLLLATIGLPLTIVILVIIGFYKLFIKKKSITSFYTPFDNITGQTICEFHEEQKILVSEDEDGDGKKKKITLHRQGYFFVSA